MRQENSYKQCNMVGWKKVDFIESEPVEGGNK